MINLDYLYNPDAVKKVFEQDYFIDKKLGFSVIENGMILPHKRLLAVKEVGRRIWGAGGIVDSDGNFFKSSFAVDGLGEAYTPPPAPETIQHRSETVIYLGLFFPVWGHIITDDIRRAWFLTSDVFKKDFYNCPIVYLTWTGMPTEWQPDVKRFLEILEVDVDRLQLITQPTRFDKIILPDGSFTKNGFTTEYRETIDRVRHFALKNRTPTSSKKIYFFYGRKQIGEEKLADYFKSKGYAIITPEQRADFDEELNLLINAESFASPIGSCAHNSVFLRDGTETIFIPRASNEFTVYQTILNQVNQINANYVDSTLSVFNERHDMFCFIISEQLKRFFGDTFDARDEENFKTFLEYFQFAIAQTGRSINPYEVQNYGKTFQDFWEQLKRRNDLTAAYDMPPNWENLRPVLTYQTHVHNRGWRDGWHTENQFSNPLEQKLDVLAVRLNFPNYNVYYSVYFNDKEGWSKEVLAPEMAGTVGVRKPIYGMRIRFDEAGAKEFNILYRMHKFDDTWTPWAKNGETLYSHGVKLNAIQVKLESKSETEKT